jgi:ribosomal protein S18 acetylase RimI-like enzyme
MIEITQASSLTYIDTARTLFREYQASLGIDLCFQNFEAELAGLPGDYAPPGGRLLLAFSDGVPVGCIALRGVTSERCEMKRLYVRPAARGLGLGGTLVQRVIDEARAIGYAEMVLDTLPTMTGAQRLYESLGFRDIPPYRENPIAGSRFLGKPLSGD